MTSSILTNDHAQRASTPAGEPSTDAAIRAGVARLSRARQSGGSVIEPAAILAEGSDSEAIIEWILAHSGRPEAVPAPAPARGLPGSWTSGGSLQRHPRRYTLPAGVLTLNEGT
jgi:hypothetical protein